MIKKISIIIFLLTSSLILGIGLKAKAATGNLITSYKQIAEPFTTLSQGYYAIEVAMRDDYFGDYEDVVRHMDYVVDVNMEPFKPSTVHDVLIDAFGIDTINQDIIDFLTTNVQVEGNPIQRYKVVVVFYVENELSYQSYNSDFPSERYNLYELKFNELPEIDPSVKTHILNYDEHFTLDDIKARYHAYDNYDNDITEDIVFASNFPTTEEEYKIGKYYITATVCDSSGNRATISNEIYIVDITKPKFSIDSISKDIDYDSVVNLEEIFKDVSCVDNYEGEIPYTAWSLNKDIDTSILGKQEIIVSYTDGSDNSSSFSLIINVVDKEAPVISVEPIEISTTNPLTEDEIVSLLVASSKIDGNYISYKITTEYFNHQNEVGIHDATISLKYSDDVVKNYRFKINVINKEEIEETFNYAPYITAGVVVFVLITATIIIVIYRRKL